MSINLRHSGFERQYSYNLTNPTTHDLKYRKKIIDKLRDFIHGLSSKYGRVYRKNYPELFEGDENSEYFTFYPRMGTINHGDLMVGFYAPDEIPKLEDVDFGIDYDEEELF